MSCAILLLSFNIKHMSSMPKRMMRSNTWVTNGYHRAFGNKFCLAEKYFEFVHSSRIVQYEIEAGLGWLTKFFIQSYSADQVVTASIDDLATLLVNKLPVCVSQGSSLNLISILTGTSHNCQVWQHQHHQIDLHGSFLCPQEILQIVQELSFRLLRCHAQRT